MNMTSVNLSSGTKRPSEETTQEAGQEGGSSQDWTAVSPLSGSSAQGGGPVHAPCPLTASPPPTQPWMDGTLATHADQTRRGRGTCPPPCTHVCGAHGAQQPRVSVLNQRMSCSSRCLGRVGVKGRRTRQKSTTTETLWRQKDGRWGGLPEG